MKLSGRRRRKEGGGGEADEEGDRTAISEVLDPLPRLAAEPPPLPHGVHGQSPYPRARGARVSSCSSSGPKRVPHSSYILNVLLLLSAMACLAGGAGGGGAPGPGAPASASTSFSSDGSVSSHGGEDMNGISPHGTDVSRQGREILTPNKKIRHMRGKYTMKEEVIRRVASDHPCRLTSTPVKVTFPDMKTEVLVSFLGYKEPNLMFVNRCKGLCSSEAVGRVACIPTKRRWKKVNMQLKTQGRKDGRATDKGFRECFRRTVKAEKELISASRFHRGRSSIFCKYSIAICMS